MHPRGESGRDLVAAIEARPEVPEGAGDRFAGYGVLGVTFPSGDVLALRRFPAASVGPGYTSVWHRDRTGRWIFCQDVEPEFGCARYFASGIDAALVAPIRIVWTAANAFSVLVDEGRRIEWRVELGATLLTRALGTIAAATPGPAWKVAASLASAASLGGALLRAERVQFTGRTPDGYRYLAQPAGLWVVTGSRAVIGGRDSGEAIRSRAPLGLGDVRIPRRGIFAVGRVQIQAPENPARFHPNDLARR